MTGIARGEHPLIAIDFIVIVIHLRLPVLMAKDTLEVVEIAADVVTVIAVIPLIALLVAAGVDRNCIGWHMIECPWLPAIGVVAVFTGVRELLYDVIGI
jgi:hypothetical protein